MICSVMIKNISVFSENEHHKSTRGKQQGENNCLPISVQLDNLEVATNFLLRIIPFSNIKFFNICILKIFFLTNLLKRASSLIMLARRTKSEVHPALRQRNPFDNSRISNLEPEGMRSSPSSHESWENGNKTWALSAWESHTSPKNDGDAVEHLQQAELESRRGRRSSGKQPDKMEKMEFASAVKQTCSFILSKFHWRLGQQCSSRGW